MALLAVASLSAAGEKMTPLQAHARALDYAAAGKTETALQILKSLENVKMPSIEKDRVELSIGRINYEKGNYDAAMAAYAKVVHGGPSWLEALEEQSWVEMRRAHWSDAIAKLQTVTLPIFKKDVDSEPYFLLALAELRVCDYKALFKTLDLFKTRFRDRVKGLEASKSQASERDLAEIGETVQKLNLVEAEAIQRLYLDENGKRRPGKVAEIDRKSDELSFPPTEGDEVWLDELEGYRVNLKGCATAAPANQKVAHAGK
jgi:hypothetical protein